VPACWPWLGLVQGRRHEGLSPPPVHLEIKSWVILGEWGVCEDPADEVAMTGSSARLGIVARARSAQNWSQQMVPFDWEEGQDTGAIGSAAFTGKFHCLSSSSVREHVCEPEGARRGRSCGNACSWVNPTIATI
jgi:hypothetical protein